MALDPVAKAKQKKRKQKVVQGLLRNLLGPVLDAVMTRWPRAFPRDMSATRPYALDICESLFKELPQFNKTSIRAVVEAVFCGPDEYLAALAAGGARYDLNGKRKGTVTPEERANAADELHRRMAKNDKARKKSESEAP